MLVASYNSRCPSVLRDVHVERILNCRSMAGKEKTEGKFLNNYTYNMHLQLLSLSSAFSFILPSSFPLISI
jgi:hypothetical protein